MITAFQRKEDIKKEWYLIDASNAVLGRLAVISANILRGKNKAFYTPNQDCGDYLIIINGDKIKLTGKKFKDKKYYRHTGYPGGLKTTTPSELNKKGKSPNMIKLAIKNMIPKNTLSKKQLSNCKIYPSSQHPHTSQNPKILDIFKLNKKNIKS